MEYIFHDIYRLDKGIHNNYISVSTIYGQCPQPVNANSNLYTRSSSLKFIRLTIEYTLIYGKKQKNSSVSSAVK